MRIQLSEAATKYHGERKKTAVLNIPGKGRIELTLSDTARCARMPDAARRTVVNLAGGEDVFDGEDDIVVAAAALHQHCRALMGIQEEVRRK